MNPPHPHPRPHPLPHPLPHPGRIVVRPELVFFSKACTVVSIVILFP